MFSCEFFEISKNTFSYRTPPVAASKYCRSCVSCKEKHTYITQKNTTALLARNSNFVTLPVVVISQIDGIECHSTIVAW